jgi:hypothetical protein
MIPRALPLAIIAYTVFIAWRIVLSKVEFAESARAWSSDSMADSDGEQGRIIFAAVVLGCVSGRKHVRTHPIINIITLVANGIHGLMDMTNPVMAIPSSWAAKMTPKILERTVGLAPVKLLAMERELVRRILTSPPPNTSPRRRPTALSLRLRRLRRPIERTARARPPAEGLLAAANLCAQCYYQAPKGCNNMNTQCKLTYRQVASLGKKHPAH